MKLRNVIAAVAMLSLLGNGAAAASAEAPYQAYVYNEWNESKASPNGYLPDRVFTGLEAGVGHFSEPQDLFADRDGALYVAD
ncbi:MAG TPA: gluconolactonase, partial [Paenibacillus sp.]|nr:gluconolactonase [Paenibacillus sp.]